MIFNLPRLSTEEVISYKTEHECGMMHAKKQLMIEKLEYQILMANNVEDLKPTILWILESMK